MRRALPVLLLLAGCAAPDPSLEPAIFVGAREDQLIAAFGVPNRTYEIAGTSALGYGLERLVGDADAPFPAAVPPGNPVPSACELTFFVREYGGLPARSRRVENYGYAGRSCR